MLCSDGADVIRDTVAGKIEDATGSELLSKLYEKGMSTADIVAQTLATGGASSLGSLGKGLIAVAKSFGDDFLRTFIKTYGDDAVRAIAAYGDDAAKLALNNADDATKLLLSSGNDLSKAALSYGDDIGKSLASTGDKMIDGWYGLVDDTVDGAASSWDDVANSLDDVADDALAGKPNTGYNGITTEGAGNAGKIITEIKYQSSSGAIFKANPNKTTTILGSFDKDMKNVVNEMGNVKSTYFGAKKGGFNVLNVPDDMYKSADQFWNEINKPWLDEAIKRGDDIVLATKPEGKYLYRFNTKTHKSEISGFGREYNYLRKNGYVYDDVTNTMIRR